MLKLAFHRTQRTEVVFAFPQLLFVIAFQIRIVLACNERGIEKHLTQIAVAVLGDISLTLYGGTALVDAAVEANVGNQFLRFGKTVDVANECHQGSRSGTSQSGDRPQELLRIR